MSLVRAFPINRIRGELGYERGFLVVTIERREVLTREAAEQVAKLARHQGAEVAVVPAAEVWTLEEEG